MKVYISGKITGLERDSYLAKFGSAQKALEHEGHTVMNPAQALDSCTVGFSQEEYLHVCYAMLDVCDAVYMLSDWQDSKGARKELQYAADWGKDIMYQDLRTREAGFPVLRWRPHKGEGGLV